MCDRVTGQCEGGCQDGWTQDKCDSGMTVLHIRKCSVFAFDLPPLNASHLNPAARCIYGLFVIEDINYIKKSFN